MSLPVFGYGSLVDPASAALTLGREARATPARLTGWRRRWTTVRDNLRCEKTFARADDGALPPFVLSLNVEPTHDRAAPLNGVLLELTEGEVQRLDIREIRYRRERVHAERDGETVDAWLYLAREENHAPQPPPGAVVMASYVRAVESAFAAAGAEELDEFRATTDEPPVEVIEAVLTRDRIPAGNPRAW